MPHSSLQGENQLPDTPRAFFFCLLGCSGKGFSNGEAGVKSPENPARLCASKPGVFGPRELPASVPWAAGNAGTLIFSFREFGPRPKHRWQMAFGPRSHLGTKNVHLQKEAAGPDPAPGAQQVGCQQGALCSESGLNLYKKLHPLPRITQPRVSSHPAIFPGAAESLSSRDFASSGHLSRQCWQPSVRPALP